MVDFLNNEGLDEATDVPKVQDFHSMVAAILESYIGLQKSDLIGTFATKIRSTITHNFFHKL